MKSRKAAVLKKRRELLKLTYSALRTMCRHYGVPSYKTMGKMEMVIELAEALS